MGRAVGEGPYCHFLITAGTSGSGSAAAAVRDQLAGREAREKRSAPRQHLKHKSAGMPADLRSGMSRHVYNTPFDRCASSLQAVGSHDSQRRSGSRHVSAKVLQSDRTA